MSSTEQHVADLRKVFQEIGRQFEVISSTLTNGLHDALSKQDLRVLGFLGSEGPQMMTALADYLNLAGNSVTTIIDRLEERKLVQRQRSDEDRRIVRVQLTDYGDKVCSEMDRAAIQFYQTMLASLTADEQAIFAVLIRKIVRVGFKQTQVATKSE